jgi:hypothetical protein
MAEKKEKDEKVVGRVLNKIDEDLRAHDSFRETVERRYRVYDAVIDPKSQANDWNNKYAPHYAFQILETMVAALIDPKRRWRVRGRSRMDSPDALTAIREGARALEILLAFQLGEDGFFVKQRAHRLQGLIAGTTAWKTCWRFEEHQRTRNQTVEEDKHDEDGNYIGSLPVVKPATSGEIVRDDPSVEVVDVRHLIWPKNAVSWETADRLTHRVFYPFDELKRLEALGVYRNVDDLKDTRGFASEHTDQEDSVFKASPGKNDVEVLECWERTADGSEQLTAIGNRKTLLRNRSSPFWHGQFPFVGCSAMPYPFRLAGKSEVEVIEDLQEMMWTLQNQQLDNLQLLNNAIVLISSDVDDVDAFEFAPGEKWLMDRADQVSILETNPITAELASGAIARIKADMQATSGGTPWLSGDQQGASSDTATEASLLTSLAQRRVSAKKHFFDLADAQVGEQFIELNQQFLDQPRYLEIVGADGEEGLQLIDPQQFNSLRFKVEIESMDESMMRQERRSEAIAKLNAVANVVAQMVGIPGQPTPNIKQYVDDILREFGVDDTDRYWSQTPPPQASTAAPGPNGAQAQPGLPGAPGDPNAPIAQDAIRALQQMMASGGGAQGGPNSG